MGQVRNLTADDIAEARRIANLRGRHSGTTPISEETLELLLATIKLPDSPRRFYGYFDGERLVSWMAVRRTALFDEPTWIILCLFTSDFHNHFSFMRPEVGLLIARAFQEAEADGYYTYVYTVAARLERVYERQWAKQSWIPMTGRYTLTQLCVVPANTEAPRAWIARLMGGTKPDDIAVKKRSLKPQHRNT